MKKDSEIQIMIISGGRMIGEYEIIKNKTCKMSLTCISPIGEVKVMGAKDLLNL